MKETTMSTSTPTSGRSVFLAGLALVTAYLLGVGVITVVAVAVHHDQTGVQTAAAKSTTIPVTLSEFKISGNLTAPAGDVKLAVTNGGTVDHNLTVGDGSKKTAMLAAGSTQTIDLGTLPPGPVQLFCSVPGHKEAGMSATLTVTAGGSSAASGDMAGMNMSSTSSTPDYAKMDADMLASFKAFPAKTAGVGNQLLQPTVLPDGTKQFELTAEIAKWEVEPGRTVDAWTYNGMVPGPMIKLNVGDHIRVLFHNKLPVNQDIHWHGIETPFAMDGVAPITQDPVKPGGNFTYDFTVDRPYMGMYHPHLHGQMTVPNGMWGVIQVGDTPIAKGITVDGMTVPPDVKPAVDMPMVLNDAGVIGFSLNGKSFPATAPIVVNQGDWVAVTYYNEGLQAHPMHLHQFPQLVTAEDGFPLPQPYWVDTLLVAPGQRFTVMFHADKKGTWAYHCHILNHAERDTGMFGMVTAVVVK
jgi:FtsP/CotA-like multicopper oxidase with cupredoxin domain